MFTYYMHIKKCKTKTELEHMYQHNYHVIYVTNENGTRTRKSEELIPIQGNSYIDTFKQKIKSLEYYDIHRPYKNATLGLEVTLTFPRKDNEQINIEAWKEATVEWLEKYFNQNIKKYGNNVVSAVFHENEVGNIHIHALIIPIDAQGRLNASAYIDGPKGLRDLRANYAKVMALLG